MAVNRIYGAISTSGGTIGSLDSIGIGVLTNGDIAVAVDDTLSSIHFYKYDSSSATAEDYPTVIAPDDVITTGRWLTLSPQYFMEDVVIEAGNKVLVNDIYGNSSDLQIGYDSGTVDITFGATTISITKDLTTDSLITSTISTGTAPFVVASTTQVDNLNAEFIGGKDGADLIVRDGSIAFTGIPVVSDTAGIPDFTPSFDYDLTTKKYVDDTAGAVTLAHDSTTGAAASRVHDDYIFADASRLFTNPPGVFDPVLDAPTADYHLTTKKFVDDEITAITDIHIVKDGTVFFTARAELDAGAAALIPTTNQLVTKGELTAATGGTVDHSTLSNLAVDDHTQYVLVTGDRTGVGFTAEISGITPTIDAHLSTKKYVDDEITLITDVYIVKSGTVAFTGNAEVANTLGVPDVTPSLDYHLTTVKYVDDSISALGSVELLENVDVYGRHDMLSNQSYVVTYGQTPFLSDRNNELVNKLYVDENTKGFLISSNDGNFDYFDTKIETNDALSVTNIYTGALTGVVVDKTTELIGGISYTEITDGGDGFFVYDSGAGYPHTYLDVTNGGIFDNTGTSGNDLTETQMFPPNDGAGVDGDIRINKVRGDVEYMEIVSQTISVTPDDTYDFFVPGDTPSTTQSQWRITIVSNVITQVERIAAGSGYSTAEDVTAIPGVTGAFTLRPYVVGVITDISATTIGSGYTSTSYNLTEATKASFTLSGEGTAGVLTPLDITFHNPINEKLKLSHYNPSPTPLGHFLSYAGGYNRTTGNAIAGFSFDEWGHITGITEEGIGTIPWSQINVNFQATYGFGYFIDNSGGAITVTLIGTAPAIGDQIVFDDYTKNAATNNITVQGNAGANTLLIEGVAAQDLVINVNGSRTTIIYVDGTYGWRINAN